MVTDGREQILLKSGREVGDGQCISGWSGNQGEATQVMLYILTPGCATEHERNPSVLGSASHRLYYSNLGGTWASESIIRGLEFIFLA